MDDVQRFATLNSRPACPKCGRGCGRIYRILEPGLMRMECKGCGQVYEFVIMRPAWDAADETKWSLEPCQE